MVALILIGVLTLALPAVSLAQERPSREESFFEWTAMTFPAAEHANRRDAIAASIRRNGGGVFLAPSGHSVRGSTFRQLDDFLYFTGLELPSSILAVDVDAGETLIFVPPRDSRFESPSRVNDFPGRPLGDDPNLTSVSGISRMEPFEEFENYLTQVVNEGRSVWIDFHVAARDPVRVEPRSINTWNPDEALTFYLRDLFPETIIRNAYESVARLRMIKSASEVAVMRQAAEISARSLLAAAGHVAEGIDERGLEAEFEAGCKRGGAQRLAFPSIIKSGPNSLWPWRILASHYDRRNRVMHSGELVIFDVGCELDHYASDMGRTFPASGTFTDDQRELLRWVTGVADSIIGSVKPGITFR